MNYGSVFSGKNTPQTQPIPGTAQVENSAGGYAFAVSPWSRLRRFLILGSEGGSYYATERALTVENATTAMALIKEDGLRVLMMVQDVVQGNLAPKVDPALFVFGLVLAYGNEAAKRDAYVALPGLCKTSTHLFQVLAVIKEHRGWSRGLRKAVARFYTLKSLSQVELQVIKYRNRAGYTHRDALRLSHPATTNKTLADIFAYVVARDAAKPYTTPDVPLIQAFEDLQANPSVERAVGAIKSENLPWEAIPSDLLKSPEVWRALIPNMGMTALLRNLGRMTACGALDARDGALDSVVQNVIARITDPKQMVGLHPYAIFVASKTYGEGHGFRGSLTWMPVMAIVAALDAAFYKSFGTIEASGKSIMLAVDVSGSMDSQVIANSNISAREAAAVMALATANIEPRTSILAFTADSYGRTASNKLVPANITPQMSLQQVIKQMKSIPLGMTDCSLPVEYALERKLFVDLFVIYTDNESYAGKRHATQALAEYRRVVNPNAKLVAVAFTATEYSIADANDPGMMDLVGFDSSGPNLISRFAAGSI